MFKKSVLALATAGLFTFPAYADLTINGFASIKAGMTMGSDEQLYGYTDDVDFKNESLFAVQVMSDLGEKLSITAQLMGRGREDFNAEFEWAFLSYQLTDNMQINAGRLRTPFYKYSDFKDVGYAYDWSRVPEAVYNLDFDNIEGVSLYRTATLGSFDSTLQFIAGSFDGDAVVTGLTVQAKIDQILGATWELSKDGISARLAYLVGKTSLSNADVDGLVGILAQSGLSAVASAIDVDEENSSFMGLALSLDKNDWVGVAEITRTEVDDSLIAEQNGYYVSLGHRFGSLTPYVSYEKRDNDAKREITNMLPQGVPAQLLLGVSQAVDRFEVKRDAWNLGLRYDFHPSAAFKAQVTRLSNDITNDDASLITLGVDLVY
ncbi:MAG: porin [Gammaproteobacteria bacterium]|nr:porin [Gammaproteobacteria bacterium]